MIRASIAAGLATSSILLAAGCGGGAASGATESTTPARVEGRESNDQGSASNTNDPSASSGGALVVVNPEIDPSRAAGLGVDIEHPVPACGPMDSYTYVASRFRCPDGTNPLGGDTRAGQGARVGNVGANSTGHIIDLYRVPCASGPVEVFVDMYQCGTSSAI